MVTPNKTKKYITRIGQKTGMLNALKNVHVNAIRIAFVPEYQNLNSGKRLMKGRNSSPDFVGSSGPSSVKTKNLHDCGT